MRLPLAATFFVLMTVLGDIASFSWKQRPVQRCGNAHRSCEEPIHSTTLASTAATDYLKLSSPKLLVKFKYPRDAFRQDANFSRKAARNLAPAVEPPRSRVSAVRKVPKPAVVAVMGHVDHGKTTLLDRIRNSTVALSEAGGITQSTTAFTVPVSDGNSITFIDTPGHAAFAAMRNRGACITDIMLLVVAADDGVMEQTLECISTAKLFHCPIVVALTKVDAIGANVGRVKEELSKAGLLLEEYGGDVQVAMVSGKSGQGIEDLLQRLLLQADVMDLKVDANDETSAVVVDSRIVKGLGTVVEMIVKSGKLCIGDSIVVGPIWGKVRSMRSSGGASITLAPLSSAVQVVGLPVAPPAGEKVIRVASEKLAKATAESNEREMAFARKGPASLPLSRKSLLSSSSSVRSKVHLLVKASSVGALEVVESAVLRASRAQAAEEAQVQLVIVHSDIGDASPSDVSLAMATKAKMVLFESSMPSTVRALAKASNVQVHAFQVMYDLLDYLEAEIQQAGEARLANSPVVGVAVVKKVFRAGTPEQVIGCEMKSGVLRKDALVRVVRGGSIVLMKGAIRSLRVFTTDAEEVHTGPCGIILENFSDVVVGDEIRCYPFQSSSQSEEV